MKSLVAALITFLFFGKAYSTPASLLKEVEKKYQNAAGIQMDVVKKLKIPLLEREKTSEGVIKIKQGGNFKWEVNTPDKTMTLLTPDSVWVVEYPVDEKDKVMVLKSRKPKKNQSPVVVAFLMGQGSLTKNFKIKLLSDKDDSQELELDAKSKDEMVQKLDVVVNKKSNLISKLSFQDAMGNQTELEFKNPDFEKKFNDEEFKFIPPKDAEVTVIN